MHIIFSASLEHDELALSPNALQKRYEHKLDSYLQEERRLMKQKELLEERRRRIALLKGKYQF